MANRDIHTMIIPDMIVPEQWARRPRWTPEQKLLHAILMDAIEVLQKHNHLYRLNLRSYHLYKEAYDWVHDDNQTYPFCFVPVCDVLGLNAQAVRAALDTACDPPGIAPRPQLTAPRKPRSDIGTTKPRAYRRA